MRVNPPAVDDRIDALQGPARNRAAPFRYRDPPLKRARFLTFVPFLVLALAGCGSDSGCVPLSETAVAPTARASAPQEVTTGATVALDGSASNDLNCDVLSYRWTLLAKPDGSIATLTAATNPISGFTADLPGDYTASLTVSDGKSDSVATTVKVRATPPNVAPVADAGWPLFVATGATATLLGGGSSDANGDALSYAWVLSAKPAGSAATLSSLTAARPSFVADLAGTYLATLTVSDGKLSSAAATVTVTAIAPRRANVPFLAANGMTVTLSSFTATPLGDGRVRYTATLSQENKTGSGIDPVGTRLFFADSTPLGDSKPLARVGPGQTAQTMTFFVVAGTVTPLLLQYDAGPLSQLPTLGALQWMLPLPLP